MKFVNWIRNKILKFLNISDRYMGVDICHDTSVFVMVEYDRRKSIFTVIGESKLDKSPQDAIISEIRHLCHKYRVKPQNIVQDWPPMLRPQYFRREV